MTTPYSKLMQSATAEAGLHSLQVPDDWMQGRSVFGGLQAALALRAMRAQVPQAPLRTLQGTFLAPVPAGAMRARAQILRSGKNATHVEARLVDGEATLALFVGVFGLARSSVVSVTPVQPAVRADTTVELRYVPGLAPNFIQHFSARWLRGLPPFTGDRGTEQVLEVTMLDEGQASEAHVLAIADFIAPIALSHLKAPAPGSTLTWMIEFLADRMDALALSGWRVDAQLSAARDGYTSQSVTIWGPGGVPVALSRQSMVVFG